MDHPILFSRIAGYSFVIVPRPMAGTAYPSPRNGGRTSTHERGQHRMKIRSVQRIERQELETIGYIRVVQMYGDRQKMQWAVEKKCDPQFPAPNTTTRIVLTTTRRDTACTR